MWWTFNMPSDQAEVTLTDVRVPPAAIFGHEGKGLVHDHMDVSNKVAVRAHLPASGPCVDSS
jgi:hypothetical protein